MGSEDVWAFYETVAGADRDGLDRVQRVVAAMCDLRQEVNSGGFDSYFRYWGGDTALDALAALAEVLGEQWAALLQQAVSLLGTDYPTAAPDREQRLNALGLEEAFDQLDERFYGLEAETDADAMLTAYLHRAGL